MLNIALPAGSPDHPETSLCFLVALALLNREPKDLSHPVINNTIQMVMRDSSNQLLLTTLLPCHIHIAYSQHMHQQLFNHLCQLMNPSDLAGIYDIKIEHLNSSKDLPIVFKFKRRNELFRYNFQVRLYHNFLLRVIFKNLREKPVNLTGKKVHYTRPPHSSASVAPTCMGDVVPSQLQTPISKPAPRKVQYIPRGIKR